MICKLKENETESPSWLRKEFTCVSSATDIAGRRTSPRRSSLANRLAITPVQSTCVGHPVHLRYGVHENRIFQAIKRTRFTDASGNSICESRSHVNRSRGTVATHLAPLPIINPGKLHEEAIYKFHSLVAYSGARKFQWLVAKTKINSRST